MALFLSTYVNKVDKKGRVSVPAQFRAALGGQNFSGVVVVNSYGAPKLEASGMDRMEKLAASLDAGMQENLADAAATLFADAQPLPFDPEGRVVLPESLLKHANIDDTAIFVGCGATFEIWNPKTFNEHQSKNRAGAKTQGLSLARLKPIGGASA